MSETIYNLFVGLIYIGIAIQQTSFEYLSNVSRQFWGILALFVTLFCFSSILRRQWVQAKPNQWLLVINNGKLVKAGIGLKTFSWFHTIVTFPCKVERVYFKANNVTIEMQGMIIEGFVFWSVYREQQGPLRFFKLLKGNNPSKIIQALCESVLRNLIANSTIDEVMKNRNHLRVHMKKSLKSQFSGWGIWLESIQITQVKISSKKLFQDLQAEFRQQTKLTAQLISISNSQKTAEAKMTSEIKPLKNNYQNQTKKKQNNLKQQLKRLQQQSTYLTKHFIFEGDKLERQKKMELQRIKNQREKQIEKLKKQYIIKENEVNFKIEEMMKKIQIDKMHDQISMTKYKIDATSRIYQSMNVCEAKISSFGENNLFNLLPTI